MRAGELRVGERHGQRLPVDARRLVAVDRGRIQLAAVLASGPTRCASISPAHNCVLPCRGGV